jgi:pimeloyl-ACP methyl ester carboxylesterase
MPKIRVRDIDIYYEIRGEGHPLLMIMGFLGNADCWDPIDLIPGLVDDYKVILFDNRGAGRTDYPGNPEEEFTIRLMADDAAALLDAIGIEHAHVMGISMGGMIAEELAINHPHKVDKLILASTYCGGAASVPVPGEAAQNIIELSNELAKKGSWDPDVASKLIPNIFTEEYMAENPGAVDVAIDLILVAPTGLAALIDQVNAILTLDICDQLSKIRSPTLILAGRRDRYIPSDNAQIMAERIPDSSVVYLDNSGHQLMEETEKVTRAVLDFLA